MEKYNIYFPKIRLFRESNYHEKCWLSTFFPKQTPKRLLLCKLISSSRSWVLLWYLPSYNVKYSWFWFGSQGSAKCVSRTEWNFGQWLWKVRYMQLLLGNSTDKRSESYKIMIEAIVYLVLTVLKNKYIEAVNGTNSMQSLVSFARVWC